MTYKTLITLFLLLTLPVRLLSLPQPALAIASSQKIAIPAYFDPLTKSWRLIRSTLKPGNIIISSLLYSDDPPAQKFVDEVNYTKSLGLRVFGYVHTSYGGRNIDEVFANIDRFKNYWGINDIFLDNFLCSAENFNYYFRIRDYIRKNNGKIIINSCGGLRAGEYCMNFADIVNIYEGSYATYLTRTFPDWVLNYPPERFSHLIYETPESSLPNAISLSKKHHAGHVYITNDVLEPSPWDTVPPYWQTELSIINQFQASSPTPTKTPTKTPSPRPTSTRIPAATKTPTPKPSSTIRPTATKTPTPKFNTCNISSLPQKICPTGYYCQATKTTDNTDGICIPKKTCNQPCSTHTNCQSGYCYRLPTPTCPPGSPNCQPTVFPDEVCRNINCKNETDCSCPPTPSSTIRPTATKTPTPKPSSTIRPTATKTPTFSSPKPTATAVPTIQCPKCPNGDANCDGHTDMNDYSLWYKEFNDSNGGVTVSQNWHADFTGLNGSCDRRVTMIDYSYWYKYFQELN